MQGTISFGVGFFFVVIGWPIIGMVLEAYGFIMLFSGFWPTLAVFLQRIPIVGWLFQQPYIRSVRREKISERMKYLQDLYQDVTKSQAKLVCLMKSSIMFNLFNGK
ncbi:hypothetical protein ES332_D08G108600v1 [Gossypium tomentosum]|uniref:Uncharacterized protein n=1 Tax=Gossypium tomentosum TaxID=34277 RepID=A0A5D2JSA7_GOSTO|nr:hypothetical protein ES332_D08G108600v1 [Gossypium tomentosum]